MLNYLLDYNGVTLGQSWIAQGYYSSIASEGTADNKHTEEIKELIKRDAGGAYGVMEQLLNYETVEYCDEWHPAICYRAAPLSSQGQLVRLLMFNRVRDQSIKPCNLFGCLSRSQNNKRNFIVSLSLRRPLGVCQELLVGMKSLFHRIQAFIYRSEKRFGCTENCF